MPGKTQTDSQEAPKARPGFTAQGEPFPGVDPNTGERKAVTFEGLQKEFGAKEGERIYWEIGRIAKVVSPNDLPYDYRPALSLNLDKETRAEVDKLLTAKVEE